MDQHIITGGRPLLRSLLCAATLGVALLAPAAGAGDARPIRDAVRFDLAELPPHNTAIRSRAVEIDLGLLDGALRGEGVTAQLQLFDDTQVSLRPDRITHPAPWMTSWVGRLDDGADASHWYTLVRNEDVVVANFWLADGRAFEIRPADDTGRVHIVHEIQAESYAPCATCAQDHGDDLRFAGVPEAEERRDRDCEDDGSVIDVLVVYTPSARNAAGGTASIQALAASAISSTNQAYLNSGVQTSVRLVHVAEVDYSEASGFSADLANLRDGVVPGVHEMRDLFNADLVAMLNNNSGACGIGYLMQSLSPGFQSLGFSVTQYSCAVGNLSFAHELGHNMGCQHDAANAGSNPLFPYSFGWRWTTNSGQLRRSVMSYAPGSRVAQFSNPQVLNGGVPTGVESSAFNAQSLNNAAYTVSNFRVSDCGPQEPRDCGWSALGGGASGGSVFAIAQHDDGSGPALYAGGSFTEAEGEPTNRIARWDGQEWTALGAGVNGAVHALASLESGPGAGLYAGGFFSTAGGLPASNIARWDGDSWSVLGSGLNNRVRTLAVHDDGSGPAVYAGGSFSSAGGAPLGRIAKWDGSQWLPLGSGLSGVVYALASHDDGTGSALYAAGYFTLADEQDPVSIARWDGSDWTPVGESPGDLVNALTVFDDGSGPKLYAGGRFQTLGGQPAGGVARWDGAGWTTLGSGLGDEVFALAAYEDASGPALFAAGNFVKQIDFAFAFGIARWDGSQWSRLGLGIGGSGARCLGVADPRFGSSLFVGGAFSSAGSQQTGAIARWSCRSILCPGDVDFSGVVDLTDLNMVLSAFGQADDAADTNGDGVVDLADLNAVLAGFGSDCN